MNRNRRWFLVSAGLVLFLSVAVLPGFWGKCATDGKYCIPKWYCYCLR